MDDYPNHSAPGWYPDPEHPGAVRFWSGSQWTEHRAPAATPPAPSRRVWPWLVGGAAVLALILGMGVAGLVIIDTGGAASQSTSSEVTTEAETADSDTGDPTIEDLDCSQLADEAVRISSEKTAGSGDVALLKVRSPKIKQDNRATLELPEGDSESVVLRCRGMGVWDDGTESPVRVELTVDSDGDPFVGYQAVD